MKRFLVTLGLLALLPGQLTQGAEIEVPMVPPPRAQPEDRKLAEKIEAGDLPGALKQAAALLKKSRN